MSIINVKPSRQKLPSTKSSEIFAAVTLTAPKLAETQRQPISIAVALDVSGSMAEGTGVSLPAEAYSSEFRVTSANSYSYNTSYPYNASKIDVAKYALIKLIENLTDKDTFSLVTFAGGVNVALTPTVMTATNRSSAISAIQRMSANGGTALAGGLYEAINQIKKTAPNQTQRVILFTDGEANVGDQHIGSIENNLRYRFHGEVPGITTFGLGVHYNGDLLTSLARNGGSHYYVDNAERIPIAFATELGSLTSMYAKDVELTLVPGKGVQILEVLNNLKHGVTNGRTWVTCDNLFSEQTYNVVLRLKVPKKAASKASTPIMSVSGRLSDILTGGTLQFDSELRVNYVGAKSADKSDDPEVMSAVAVQVAAKAQRDAMEQAKRGDVAGGRATLTTAAATLSGYGRQDLADVSLGVACSGYVSMDSYKSVGSKLSASVGHTYSTQNASSGGVVLNNVDVDKGFSNTRRRSLVNSFSITKSATPTADDMPNVFDMVTP